MRVVIYVRDNTLENDEDSIEEQLRECRMYAERYDLEVVDTYIERGQGCIDYGQKDELEALLEDSESKAFDIVIVAETACLTQCFFELYYCFKRLWKNHIKIVCARDFIREIIYPCQECYRDFFESELLFE